jgi:signal transduction histidine kinase
MLRRAVLNLVLNALDAMPDGGTLQITAVAAPSCVELEVADSGPGLSADVLPRVFEPFFTTKQGGTGLGLAIVSRIAEAHGGSITATNCPEGGAAFTLRIPTEGHRPRPGVSQEAVP